MQGFDVKTKQALKYYVYALMDPDPIKKLKGPFYIGVGGFNDRIFNHVEEAKKYPDRKSEKLERIREIQNRPGSPSPEYLILRHGIEEQSTAYVIESVLIDCLRTFGLEILNDQSGHDSHEFGVLSLKEVFRKFQAPILNTISNDCVIININRKFRRDSTFDIYGATKKEWVIAAWRIGNPEKPTLKYVLSEYESSIIEVFEVQRWYKIGKRWGFDGKVAPENIKSLYVDHRVLKKAKQQWPLVYQI